MKRDLWSCTALQRLEHDLIYVKFIRRMLDAWTLTDHFSCVQTCAMIFSCTAVQLRMRRKITRLSQLYILWYQVEGYLWIWEETGMVSFKLHLTIFLKDCWNNADKFSWRSGLDARTWQQQKLFRLAYGIPHTWLSVSACCTTLLVMLCVVQHSGAWGMFSGPVRLSNTCLLRSEVRWCVVPYGCVAFTRFVKRCCHKTQREVRINLVSVTKKSSESRKTLCLPSKYHGLTVNVLPPHQELHVSNLICTQPELSVVFWGSAYVLEASTEKTA